MWRSLRTTSILPLSALLLISCAAPPPPRVELREIQLPPVVEKATVDSNLLKECALAGPVPDKATPRNGARLIEMLQQARDCDAFKFEKLREQVNSAP